MYNERVMYAESNLKGRIDDLENKLGTILSATRAVLVDERYGSSEITRIYHNHGTTVVLKKDFYKQSDRHTIKMFLAAKNKPRRLLKRLEELTTDIDKIKEEFKKTSGQRSEILSYPSLLPVF